MEPAAALGAGLSERESITPARSKSPQYLEPSDLATRGSMRRRGSRRTRGERSCSREGARIASALHAARRARGRSVVLRRASALARHPAARRANVPRCDLPIALAPMGSISGRSPPSTIDMMAHGLLTQDSKQRSVRPCSSPQPRAEGSSEPTVPIRAGWARNSRRENQ